MTGRIAVLGSINMDLVTEVPRLPRPGETVTGRSFARYPGGKGANQAVAAARMNGQVAFYGKVGEDFFGEELLAGLRQEGVCVDAVGREPAVPSGIAAIVVAEGGENTIAYTPGANAQVDRRYVDSVLPAITSASIVLLQLETPLETVAYLLSRLPESGPLVILNPAPAQGLSSLLLARVGFITPNRGELETLAGVSDIPTAGRRLLAQGVTHVVCTAGEEGVHLIEAKGSRHFPAVPVRPIDTTAAGDAFNGALAAAMAEGQPVEAAISWANACGALSTTRRGAQPSLPRREELEAFLRDGAAGKTRR
jgi:ribokinase